MNNINIIKLNEDSRRDLINQSKRGDAYEPGNRGAGRNRHQRRLKSRIGNSVKEFNSIDMNKLFKEDILDINIRVNGETNLYLVEVSFSGFLNSLAGFMTQDMTDDDLNFRMIWKALLDAFNHNDVKVHCTCPDFQYRQAYWLTVNGNNAGPAETRPSDETNPDDSKGAGCKHINLVLNNNSWMMKVASVVHNYIKYMKQYYTKLYTGVIYPAIFDREYVEPEESQEDTFNKLNNEPEDELDSDEMPSDEDTIDTSNKWARTKNQFKPGNKEGIRFTSSPKKQLDIDSIDTEDEVPEENSEEQIDNEDN